MVKHSATLALDEALRARRAAGRQVLHLGFGEAGLPVPGTVAEVLAGAAGRNGYGPSAVRRRRGAPPRAGSPGADCRPEPAR